MHIYARIVSDYPDDETTDLTLAVDPGAGETAEALHRRILAAIEAGAVFEVRAARDPEPIEFTGELVRSVAVWEG